MAKVSCSPSTGDVDNNKEPAATSTIMFVLFAVMCAGLCIILIRNSVTVLWPLEVCGCEWSRLSTVSFVVALSFEHMAFHVFVQAGYSDPYLYCP